MGALLILGGNLPEALVAQSQGVVDPLEGALRRLSDPDPFVRRKAAGELGSLRDLRAAVGLTEALRDESPFVRSQAADSLGLLRTKEAAPDLGALVERDPDPQARKSAALALGYILDPQGVPSLLACLKDREVSVVHACVTALANLKAPEAAKPLGELLSRIGSNDHLKASVLAALGRIGSKEAYEPIRRELKKGGLKPMVEEEALKAMGLIGGSDAARLAQKRLKSKDGRIRSASCWALGRLKVKSALLNCLALLKHPEARVRRNAAEALGGLGTALTVDVLEEALKVETDPGVAEGLNYGLEELKSSLRQEKG